MLAALACALPLRASELASASPVQFQATVTQMRQLTAACAVNANDCDAKKVSPDQVVTAANVFTMRWDWLSAALTKAQKAKPEERATLMRDCAARLDELAGQTSGAPAGGDFAHARSEVNTILAREEFQTEQHTSWWEIVMGWIGSMLSRLFSGLGRAASAVPWMGPVLEWGLFLAAAALLGFFLLRALSRQRLRVDLTDGAQKLNAWSRESEDWARLAEASAAAGDWREAVHGLYWAAIVLLESRRAWRHNPSRTPREYVRLLKPGSTQQSSLRGLTQIFERVWYGFDEIGGEEYGRARAMFDALAQPVATTAQPAAATAPTEAA